MDETRMSTEVIARRVAASLLPFLCLGAIPLVFGCGGGQKAPAAEPAPEGVPPLPRFGDTLAFLRRHTDVILLRDRAGQAEVVVTPALQGRVMTSTTDGSSGPSFGWVNQELIAEGTVLPHMNAYGGEDRFWLGPEAGQFGLFFQPGAPFDLDHWQVPAPFDTEPWHVLASSRREARIRHDMTVQNYAGTTFHVRVDRTVRLLSKPEIQHYLGIEIPKDLDMVAYETRNSITNDGAEAWTRETGLLSIWILGMYQPSPDTTVLIPFETGTDDALGPVVNDRYFGKVPESRLKVDDGLLYFRADGQHRSKIGMSARRAKGIMGSYDAAHEMLTLVQFSIPPGDRPYVNSMWEVQEEPFAGDAAHAYNDGPPAPGEEPFGPFYELESSSPAAAIAPGDVMSHNHRTIHLTGPVAQLDDLLRHTFGTTIDRVQSATSP